MPVSFKMKILAERLMWSLGRKCFKKKSICSAFKKSLVVLFKQKIASHDNDPGCDSTW